jgi:hypothetical protein
MKVAALAALGVLIVLPRECRSTAAPICLAGLRHATMMVTAQR